MHLARKQEQVTVSLTETPPSIRRVLVLEDNYIIAMEAEDILTSLGVAHVDIATNTAQARALVEAQQFDFALLDVNLGNETSFDFAVTLIADGTPLGFVTGYGEGTVFPPGLRHLPRITKPFNETSMANLLAGLADKDGI